MCKSVSNWLVRETVLNYFDFIAAVTARNKVSSAGRRKQQKLPDPVLVSDEESVEDESVTRCVCGESRKFTLGYYS